MANNLKFNFSIAQVDRVKRLNQQPKLIWFTGLPCSGKSTLANALELEIFNKGKLTYILDGDSLRSGINSDLGFSMEERKENLRRVAEIAKILLDAGIFVIAAFISPLESDRALVKEIVGSENYYEIFVDTPLDICEKRDVKGLYKKARVGEIKNFTGVDSPYERPSNPNIILKTNNVSLDFLISHICKSLTLN